MPAVQWAGGNPSFLPRPGLEDLIATLRQEGYTVVGPKAADGVISVQPITSAQDLPHGVQDDQEAGSYRLIEGDPELCFQYVVGADGPKRYLLPPVLRLFSLSAKPDYFALQEGPPAAPKLAFLGIRPCEVAAMAIQDRVFGTRETGRFRCEADSYYQETRREALVIAVQCIRPGRNCFCSSMGTGPVAREGFDLALTELRGGFVLEVGSPRGKELVGRLPVREPTSAELELAELRREFAATSMTKQLDTQDLAEILHKAVEHPHWDEVAKRCLGCGNCTQVCPTCFCSTVVDSTALTGDMTSRTRYWESCFTHQFSYTTAGPVRSTIRARYRHWLSHKLSTWYEQFGSSGCVGCGRCITWCPAKIDITEEAAAIRGDGHWYAAASPQTGRGVVV
ncbi:MAG: 4Fe-4S dicluster domain-containing protein [Armatimonadota bacterium]|nr:4Fe-4S dicluster domain-containing protein [Armatimonadota bacterium]